MRRGKEVASVRSSSYPGSSVLAENDMDLSEMPIVGKNALVLRWSGQAEVFVMKEGKKGVASQK
jgi:hypothetical protein